MDRQQFLLRLRPDCGAQALFELRHSDDERLFHVAFRPGQRRVVVNDMHAGRWGQERGFDLPTGFRAGDPVLCHRAGQAVLVLLEGLQIRFDIAGGRLGRADLQSVGSGLTAEWLPPPRMAQIVIPSPAPAPVSGTGPDTGPEGRAEAGPDARPGRIGALPLAGGLLQIPPGLAREPAGESAPDAASDLAPDLALELALELHFGQLAAVPDYLRFVTAQVVAHRLDAVVVDKVRARTAALALAHARLLPTHQVHLLCTDPDRAAALAAIARHNGLDNLHLHLPPGPGEVAHSGPAADAGAGPTLPEALPEALRAPVRLIVTGDVPSPDLLPPGTSPPSRPDHPGHMPPQGWAAAMAARCARTAPVGGTELQLLCYGTLPARAGPRPPEPSARLPGYLGAVARMARRLTTGGLTTGGLTTGGSDTEAPPPPVLQPGLDVVVALYNTLPYVVACIDSLLQGPDTAPGTLRILVVDDGSTDGSGALVARHFGTDPRVRLLPKPNGGCASARNHGRLMSDRSHIAFVDADDFTDPGFFAGLYGLALETGAPVVQGGFDFHDPRHSPADNPYADDLALQPQDTGQGTDQTPGTGVQAFRAPVTEALLRSQPSVWRRVYRRDFLDRHDIWFPESIRAYDDYLFQILCFSHLRDIRVLPGAKYRYRQHPDQDIRQGDARHFNMLAMFGMLMRRAAAGSWDSFDAQAQTMLDAIEWSGTRLQPALTGVFLREAAHLCVALTRIWGPQILSPERLATVRHPDFAWLVATETARVADLPDGLWWAGADPALAHPDTVNLHLALRAHL